jgi:hypothetical protein
VALLIAILNIAVIATGNRSPMFSINLSASRSFRNVAAPASVLVTHTRRSHPDIITAFTRPSIVYYTSPMPQEETFISGFRRHLSNYPQYPEAQWRICGTAIAFSELEDCSRDATSQSLSAAMHALDSVLATRSIATGHATGRRALNRDPGSAAFRTLATAGMASDGAMLVCEPTTGRCSSQRVR